MSGVRSNQMKRKRKQEKSSSSSSSSNLPSDENDKTSSTTTSFRRWLDEGTRNSDGTTDHEVLGISIGNNNHVVSLGDSVSMRVSEPMALKYQETSNNNTTIGLGLLWSDGTEDAAAIARIERMWEEPVGSPQQPAKLANEAKLKLSRLKIRARWFLRRTDMAALQENLICPATKEEFLNKLSTHDLILSSLVDDNHVTTICGLCNVLYRQPADDESLPKLASDSFLCRYSLDFDRDKDTTKLVLTPYTGKSDDWSLLPESDRSTRKRRRTEEMAPAEKKTSSGSTQEDGDESSPARDEQRIGPASSDEGDSIGSDGFEKAAAPEAEGSSEKRDIRVGPEHQAVVPEYVPNQKLQSRKPTLIWRAGSVSQSQLDRFFDEVAKILTPYLKLNLLTSRDPYSPLPSHEIEAAINASHGEAPTLSSICTASSLSTNRNNLLRECDADALLDVLHQNNYNEKVAVAAVRASPRNFLTVWSLEEKETFNSGFRRYSGSLRMISKGFAQSKSFKDVIDYHYRFKIPDQFRRFQEKKREQAVRMMECIETRRYMNCAIPTQSDRASMHESGGAKRAKGGEWAKTSMSDVVGSTERRRTEAKQLLLEVEKKYGKEKMIEVVNAIKCAVQKKSSVEFKGFLVQHLKDHDMIKRFDDFLPVGLRY